MKYKVIIRFTEYTEQPGSTSSQREITIYEQMFDDIDIELLVSSLNKSK